MAASCSFHFLAIMMRSRLSYDEAAIVKDYWLKHKSEMKGLLRMPEKVVDVSAQLEWLSF